MNSHLSLRSNSDVKLAEAIDSNIVEQSSAVSRSLIET
jgi:hypothetical protein